MKTTIKRAIAAYDAFCVSVVGFARKHETALFLTMGVLLLGGGLTGIAHADLAGGASEAAFDDSLIKGAVGNLFLLIEGAFGALIMVVAGLGAIVAAAMGAYRAAVGMLVVAVGAFILRALVSLFFGTDFEALQNK